jgi:hypothetical protein
MMVLHLQAMIGHFILEMVQYYAQRMVEDLIRDHKSYPPIGNPRRR